MRKRFQRMSAALLLAAAAATPALAQVGTGLTYQGRLQVSGTPVNGTADLQFRLFDSSSGGFQIGPTASYSNVNVTDGLVTINSIDFGDQAFNGNARWLEVAVRSPAGSGSFVILTPRQRINATPYALKVPGVDGHSLDAADGSPVDVVYVTNSGDVGIGTTTPQGRFEVRSGNGSYWRIDSTNGDLHGNGGTDGVMGLINDTVGNNARTDIVVNNQAHLVVRGNGNVGIGTGNPTSRLEIFGQDGLAITGFQPFMTLRDANAGGARALFSTANGDIGFYTNAAIARQFPSVLIKDNDWVGMGVVPGYRLDLPNIGSADGRGRANRWDTYSSARWKENVRTIENALDKVMQLRGVSFDWKAEHGGGHDVGFIAEEVGRVVPELVTWEADGQNAQGLAYDRLTALTVEAIKEQQTRIEDLERANAELREQLDKLVLMIEAKVVNAAK